MKTYYLISKSADEIVNRFTCQYIEDAVSYFSRVKKLSKKDLLHIFHIKEAN
jgi:hypothetical protein